MRNLTTVRLAEGNTGWINAHSARWCIRAAHSFRSPCRCETTLHARLRYISVCVESRSTRHTGARPPVKAMQLGPRARASLGVAARACRQRTKRRRTSAVACSAPARDSSTPAVLLALSKLCNRSRRTTGMCGLRAASPAASAASRPADDGPRPPCSTTAQEECSGCTCEQSTRAIASWPSGRTVPTSQAQRSG